MQLVCCPVLNRKVRLVLVKFIWHIFVIFAFRFALFYLEPTAKTFRLVPPVCGLS